jgi:hypothetical protein
MSRYVCVGTMAICLGIVNGCQDSRSDVQQQTRDLSEAQNRSPEVAKQIESDLAKAKAEVVELEKKLALARQGVTDDVIQQKAELEQSLHEQQRKVEGAIKDAKRQAEASSQDTAKAAQQLQQVKVPANVEAEVQTRTQVVPGNNQVQVREKQDLIPVTGREVRTYAADAGAQRTR